MATTIKGARLLSLAALLGLGAACAPNPPPGAMYVERRPPPVRVEVIGVAPGPGFIWIGGFWRWGGGQYVWVPGRWAARERGYHHWNPGRWRHTRRGWYWVEGRWR
jgi:YXWGXW repeat-containing protein